MTSRSRWADPTRAARAGVHLVAGFHALTSSPPRAAYGLRALLALHQLAGVGFLARHAMRMALMRSRASRRRRSEGFSK